jgi:hypothetical protein
MTEPDFCPGFLYRFVFAFCPAKKQKTGWVIGLENNRPNFEFLLGASNVCAGPGFPGLSYRPAVSRRGRSAPLQSLARLRYRRY